MDKQSSSVLIDFELITSCKLKNEIFEDGSFIVSCFYYRFSGHLFISKTHGGGRFPGTKDKEE